MSTLEEEIKAYMIDYLKTKFEAGITDESNVDEIDLLGSGVMSSLGYIELITGIEERFNLEIDFDEVEPSEYSTLSGLAALAEKSKAN